MPWTARMTLMLFVLAAPLRIQVHATKTRACQ